MIVRNPHLETLISTLNLEVVGVEKLSWNTTEKREFQSLIRKAEICLFSVEQVYVGVLHFTDNLLTWKAGETAPDGHEINTNNTAKNGKEKYNYDPTFGWTIWLATSTKQTK